MEQGGIKSGEFYKMYNNEQLTISQNSDLGIAIGNIKVSAIGQADDVVLLSSNINCLSHLLTLTMSYCSRYSVDLSHEKPSSWLFPQLISNSLYSTGQQPPQYQSVASL